jgi:hypothetical protein
MPYIKNEERKKYEKLIQDLVDTLLNAGVDQNLATVGDVNYVISSVIWKLFDKKTSYTNGNNLIGVLECVKQEFYRRKLAPYEEEKIKENGDI